MDNNWRTDPPTEPGWYWVKEKGKPLPVIVELWKIGDWMQSTDFLSVRDDRFDCWLGPLEVPQPAEIDR